MDKRYIAPVVITILSVIYFLGIAICFVCSAFEGVPLMAVLLMLFIPLGAAALIVYMLIQRIKEIKGGEEDEARKY